MQNEGKMEFLGLLYRILDLVCRGLSSRWRDRL